MPATTNLMTLDMVSMWNVIRFLLTVLVLLNAGVADVLAETPASNIPSRNDALLNLGDAFRNQPLSKTTEPKPVGSSLSSISVTAGRTESTPIYDATSVHAEAKFNFAPTEMSPHATTETVVCWKAPLLMQQPVYFEDVALERYGQTAGPCIQPFISAGKFATSAVLLPYKMGVDPVGRRSYVVGYARPGDATRTVQEHLPLSARGILFQAGAVVGAGAFLAP